MDTCSEKRTLGGLVRRRAFLAALMKADLGDWGWEEREELLNQLERRDVNERKAPVTAGAKETCVGEPANAAAMRQPQTCFQHETHQLKV